MTNKYRNTRVEYDGYTFDSVKEKDRFVMLRLLLGQGRISNLIHQPDFVLLEDFVHQGDKIRGFKYVADFEYYKDGIRHVEDVKSPMTHKLRDYILKKKIFLSQHPEIIFLET